jgi:PAS domain-containing protein
MDYERACGLAQALFEEYPDARFLLDAEGGRVLDANAVAQRLCGFALRDLMSMPAENVFRSRRGPGLAPLAARVRRVHRPCRVRQCQMRTVHKAAWLAADLTLTRLAVRPEPLLLCAVRPVAAAGGGSGRLRRLIRAVHDCLWIADVSRRGEVCFRYVSCVVARVTGRPARYFGPDLDKWRVVVHPDDRGAWADAWSRRRAGLATDDLFRVVRPDGSVRWVREAVSPAAAPQTEQPLRLYGALSDITPLPAVRRAGPVAAGPGGMARADHQSG